MLGSHTPEREVPGWYRLHAAPLWAEGRKPVVEPFERGAELGRPQLPVMPARVDAEGRLDAGLAERAMKRDVALLEAREVIVADGEIKGRPVRIGDVGRQAEKHVPAVEPARVEGLAEGG